jgi:hypothetical protein
LPRSDGRTAIRYHGGGFAGFGLLPDEVPIIARRGELLVPPERGAREEKTAREQQPITMVVNVTAADASSLRASRGQIAADLARAIDRASRNRSAADPWSRCHAACAGCRLPRAGCEVRETEPCRSVYILTLKSFFPEASLPLSRKIEW